MDQSVYNRRSFLAVTFSPQMPMLERKDFENLLTIRVKQEGSGLVRVLVREDLSIWCSNAVAHASNGEGGGCFILANELVNLAAKKRESAQTLLKMLMATSLVPDEATYEPPYSIAYVENEKMPLRLWSDAVGLNQIYTTSSRHWAAASTSSVLLAQIGKRKMDPIAVRANSRIGFYPASTTPYLGVKKPPAFARIELQNGHLSEEIAPPKLEPALLNVADVVDEGQQTIAGIVHDLLHMFESLDISLSAGLDSRLVLAAVPPAERHRLTGVTIGQQDDLEIVTARRLADLAGCRHQVVDLQQLTRLSDDSLRELIQSGSFFRNHSANPLNAAVLEWSERQLEQRPRLNGQNGEFARGFYYAGQFQAPAPNPQIVSRLIKWRLFSGEQVNDDIFSEEFRSATSEGVFSLLSNQFDDSKKSWLETTDEFYLSNRMQRWAGLEATRAAELRTDISPFFNERFLSWARSIPPGIHRGKLMHQIMVELDSDMAGIAINGGSSSVQYSKGGPLQPFREGIRYSQKFLRKVRQRLGQAKLQHAGVSPMLNVALLTLKNDRDIQTTLLGSPVFNSEFLEAAIIGNQSLDSASMACLLSIYNQIKQLE